MLGILIYSAPRANPLFASSNTIPLIALLKWAVAVALSEPLVNVPLIATVGATVIAEPLVTISIPVTSSPFAETTTITGRDV